MSSFNTTITIGDVHGDFKIITEILFNEFHNKQNINMLNLVLINKNTNDEYIISTTTSSIFSKVHTNNRYNENIEDFINSLLNFKDKFNTLYDFYENIKNKLLNDYDCYLSFDVDNVIQHYFNNRRLIILGDIFDTRNDNKNDLNDEKEYIKMFNLTDNFLYSLSIKINNHIISQLGGKMKNFENDNECNVILFKNVFELITFKLVKYLKKSIDKININNCILILGNHEIREITDNYYDFIFNDISLFTDRVINNKILYSHNKNTSVNDMIINLSLYNNVINSISNLKEFENYYLINFKKSLINILFTKFGKNNIIINISNIINDINITDIIIDIIIKNIQKYDKFIQNGKEVYYSNLNEYELLKEHNNFYNIYGHTKAERTNKSISLDITMSRFKRHNNNDNIIYCYLKNTDVLKNKKIINAYIYFTTDDEIIDTFNDNLKLEKEEIDVGGGITFNNYINDMIILFENFKCITSNIKKCNKKLSFKSLEIQQMISSFQILVNNSFDIDNFINKTFIQELFIIVNKDKRKTINYCNTEYDKVNYLVNLFSSFNTINDIFKNDIIKFFITDNTILSYFNN